MAILFSPFLRATDQANAPIPGAFATFYATGTSTLQPVWSEFTLTIAAPNPVQADSNGVWPAIWLDDLLPAYKVVFQYPDVNNPSVPGAIIAGPNGTTDPYNSGFDAAKLMAKLFPLINVLSPAEQALGVIPVNYTYPPLTVERYGTNTTPGTTLIHAAFQTAINVMRQGGGRIRWGRTAPYLLGATLDCTYGTSANQYGLNFDGGDGPVATDRAGLIAKHGGYVFDMTGCDAYNFSNLSVGTDATIFPQLCFLMARADVAGNNSQVPRFNNVRVNGSFSKSVIYNYACEDGVYTGCYFANQCTAAGTKVVTITATNILGLTSSFVTIRTGSQSCTDHAFVGGQFWNAAGTSTSDVFYFDNCTGVKIYAPWMLNSSATAGGRAYFYVETVNGGGGHIKLRDIVGEDTAFYSQYGVFFNNNVSTPSDWTIQACYLPNTVAPVSAGASVTLDKFDVGHITQQAGNAWATAGTVQYSTIDGGVSMPLSIGASKQNELIGDVAGWTIASAARNKDHWVDTGLGQYAFTANTSGITFSGGTPTKSANISYHGRQATVNISLSGATTLTATAGQQITGLPAAATQSSAQVTVWDQTSNIALGAGYVTGSAITLPAFTATTHTVQITATYFAS